MPRSAPEPAELELSDDGSFDLDVVLAEATDTYLDDLDQAAVDALADDDLLELDDSALTALDESVGLDDAPAVDQAAGLEEDSELVDDTGLDDFDSADLVELEPVAFDGASLASAALEQLDDASLQFGVPAGQREDDDEAMLMDLPSECIEWLDGPDGGHGKQTSLEAATVGEVDIDFEALFAAAAAQEAGDDAAGGPTVH